MSLDIELWEYRHPGARECVYSCNITHNCRNMAQELGVYEHIWRPEEIGKLFAGELIACLSVALSKISLDPEEYRKFEPENKWGTVETLTKFLRDYLGACIEYPSAAIVVDR